MSAQAVESVGGSVAGRKMERQPNGGYLNRGGRRPGTPNKPRPARERVTRAAARKCTRAISVLARIMDDESEPGTVRITACREILNRGIGRPAAWHDDIHSEDTEAAGRARILEYFQFASAGDDLERENERLREENEELVAQLEAAGLQTKVPG